MSAVGRRSQPNVLHIFLETNSDKYALDRSTHISKNQRVGGRVVYRDSAGVARGREREGIECLMLGAGAQLQKRSSII
jgi:hypothetical protein